LAEDKVARLTYPQMIMSVELDPPYVASRKKKRSRRFGSVRHGYDPGEVDDFLGTIASRLEKLESELHEVHTAEATPPADPEAYTQRITRLTEVGVREVEKMLAESKAEAATIVSEAQSEADRIRRDAQQVAERSVDEARAFLSQVEVDAKMMRADVAERRRQMTEELQRMQGHLVNVAHDLNIVLNPIEPYADLPGSSTSEAEPG
jgi:DivIVA domain-containing protein